MRWIGEGGTSFLARVAIAAVAATLLGAWLLPAEGRGRGGGQGFRGGRGAAGGAGLRAQAAGQQGPGPGGPAAPQATDFLEGTACRPCHSASVSSDAMLTDAGEDGSPASTWAPTLMANAFRDPYWRAKVSAETAATPDQVAQVEALCLRCHGPMAHEAARLAGRDPPRIAAAAADPLARDGVSCTLCHQVDAASLAGAPAHSGGWRVEPVGRLFGPYEAPFGRPMWNWTGYEPTFAAHVRDPRLCASCHTHFTTAPGGERFPEQVPYLEWLNSDYAAGNRAQRTCVECHLPLVGTTRIARQPSGGDFPIPERAEVRMHRSLGGNAAMLDLLREHSAELGVTATSEELEAAAATARAGLASAARIEIRSARRKRSRVRFQVEVQNLAGHKLPTGYPSRRAWLRVQVLAGDEVVFDSGGVDASGRIVGIADEAAIPHPVTVRRARDVVVYECVPVDAQGVPATRLKDMARLGKDTRLLPAGWRADGPEADVTWPVGVEGDPDFVGGGDSVRFRLRLEGTRRKDVQVRAWLLYQSIAPRWVDALRGVATAEATSFVRMIDAMPQQPEVLGYDEAALER